MIKKVILANLQKPFIMTHSSKLEKVINKKFTAP